MKKTRNMGIPEDFREDIARAIQILKEEGCSEIFLFGSGAEGQLREESDLDLAVRGCSPGHFFACWAGCCGSWIILLISSI